jgi:hypothetical protein
MLENGECADVRILERVKRMETIQSYEAIMPVVLRAVTFL